MAKNAMAQKMFSKVVDIMFRQMIVVFLKEIKSILRDRRTFIFGLLLPLLLVPTMLLIVDFSILGIQDTRARRAVVAMNRKNNSFYNFFSVQDLITVEDVIDVQKALDSGEISAYITVDEDIDQKVINNENFELNIKYGNGSINSVMAIPTIKQYEGAYRHLVGNHNFNTEEELKNAIDVKVSLSEFLSDIPFVNTSSLYFSMLVPITIILYCCMGSAGTASELSVGEKEHGTLEPLLATCASRTGIILGKLFATTAMGVTSGLCTAIGIWVYLIFSSTAVKNNVSVLSMILLLIMTVFISMFFASINLLIGVYAKSYKEAQTYMMPISILCVIPNMFSYGLEAGKIGVFDLCIPVYNVICIIKEILADAVNGSHLLIVLLWLSVYISLVLSLIIKLFKKESILFRV